MSNLFQKITTKWKNTKFVIVVCVVAAIGVLVSLNLIVEDFTSSMRGLQALELRFAVDSTIYEITYASLSAMPQLFQILLLYLYQSDTNSNKMALRLFFVFFAIDFASDWFHRSSNLLFDPIVWQNNPENLIVAGLMTLIAYTVSSEILFSLAAGVFLETFSPAAKQVSEFVSDARRNVNDASEQIRGGAKPQPKITITDDDMPSSGPQRARRG